MSLVVEILETFLGKNRGHNATSGQVQFDCPACSEDQGMPQGNGKGNLEVNYNKGVFHCWVCGETNRMRGRLPYLINRYGNKKILENFLLVKPEFIKRFELDVDNSVQLPKEYKEISKTPKTYNMYGEAMYYLRSRGVTDDIIKDKRIGYCYDGKYAGRIIIPSYDPLNEVNFFIGRSFKRWVKPKILNEDVEKTEIIFNEGLINWDSTVYLVEGPFDHIVTPNSIPLLGKILHDNLFITLQEKAKSNVIIMLDGDAYEDAKKIYRKLNVGNLKGRVKVIQLHPKYDPSKIYERFGRRKYIEVLSNTKRVSESKIY